MLSSVIESYFQYIYSILLNCLPKQDNEEGEEEENKPPFLVRAGIHLLATLIGLFVPGFLIIGLTYLIYYFGS